MGVLTTELLPAGKLFGPIPSNLGLTDPAFLIGHMTSDNRPDVHTVKVSVGELSDGSRAGEWVPHVQAARDEREQNLEACLMEGQLHYRALRTLPAGAELKVWYHRDLATALAIPELQPAHIKEGGIYQCPYCMETFRYPNSLRAHMRFKCQQRSAGMDSGNKLATGHQERLMATYRFPYMAGPYDMSAAHMYPYRGFMGNNMTESIRRTLPSPVTSGSAHSPSHMERSPRTTPEKRPVEDSDSSSPPPKRLSAELGSPRLSPSPDSSPRDRPSWSSAPSSSPRETSPRDRSPWSKVSSTSPREPTSLSRLDQNQNVNDVKDEEETVSAFRKVEKHHAQLSPPMSSHTSMPSTASHSSVLTSSTDSLTKNMANTVPHPSFLPRYPMIGVLPPPLVPVPNYNENVPLNIADIYRNNLKMAEMPRLSDKLTDIRNMENNSLALKLPFMANRASLPVQYYKSHNPMVDKLLQNNMSMMPSAVTQLSLLQNWCAKCNATFRMTSDLVYHMRSHHHIQKDAVKVKREEKLKCSICGETFRERHHLTRHMTSHS